MKDSRLDYCNSLLSGCPKHLIDKLQRVQNASARLIYRVKKSHNIQPLLKSLHWLPIACRTQYKLSTLCFDVVSGSGPSYLSNLLQMYTPSRHLRSSSDTRLFRIPRVAKKSFGERSFSHLGPNTWNNLPVNLRNMNSNISFRHALKTHYFRE